MMGGRWAWSSLLAMAMTFLVVAQAAACTGIVLRAADGSVVRGRTLEFADPLDSDVILIPRGLAMTGTTPDGKSNGLQWTAKYAAGGANGMGLPVIIDGLNEKGLGGGIFYLPGFAGYQASGPDTSKALAPWELMTWALTSFATVDEVKAALPDVEVVATPLAALGGVPPVHYFLTDLTGASLVIEYIDGDVHTYDDEIGVVTNSPSFDWHMTNLRNYLNISPGPDADLDLDGVSLDPLSTGENLLGIPGDFSSPARFVRATIFSHMMPEQASGEAAVLQGFHILDNFDVPLGAVPEPAGSNPPLEVTEWTTMSDLKALKFYIWTFDNRDIRTLDLSTATLDGDAVQTFELNQAQGFTALDAG